AVPPAAREPRYGPPRADRPLSASRELASFRWAPPPAGRPAGATRADRPSVLREKNVLYRGTGRPTRQWQMRGGKHYNTRGRGACSAAWEKMLMKPLDKPEPPQTPPGGTNHPSSPPRVLIADDNPQGVELLEAYLAGCDYEIQTAADGEETLRKVGD